MNLLATLVVLAVGCLHQADSHKIADVKTRRTYKDGNKKSMPDAIQFDLILGKSKIRWNLVKMSKGPELPPVTVTNDDGTLSTWTPPENDRLANYEDETIGARATVTFNPGDQSDELQFMATFRHNRKSYSMLPEGLPTPVVKEVKGKVSVGFTPENGKAPRSDTLSVRIDGVPHTLMEMVIDREL